jgi:hypothetical protein
VLRVDDREQAGSTGPLHIRLRQGIRAGVDLTSPETPVPAWRAPPVRRHLRLNRMPTNAIPFIYGTPLAFSIPERVKRCPEVNPGKEKRIMSNIKGASRAVTAAAMIGLTGCAQLGNLGGLADILGAVGGGAGQQQQGQLTAEVQQVNTRQQTIQIRTQDGQSGAVLYDQNTVVVYQQQQYPVTALEAGDVANFQLRQAANNSLYAARIDVVQSVQQRTGQSGSGQLFQLAGRVGNVDQTRGIFELQTQTSGVILVSLPRNPGNAVTDRFRRLRSGDSVGVEGHMVAQGRLELTRFL